MWERGPQWYFRFRMLRWLARARLRANTKKEMANVNQLPERAQRAVPLRRTGGLMDVAGLEDWFGVGSIRLDRPCRLRRKGWLSCGRFHLLRLWRVEDAGPGEEFVQGRSDLLVGYGISVGEEDRRV